MGTLQTPSPGRVSQGSAVGFGKAGTSWGQKRANLLQGGVADSICFVVFPQSFRFGVEIAYVGATILDVCKRVRKKTLVGGNHQSKAFGSSSFICSKISSPVYWDWPQSVRSLPKGGIRGDAKGQVALLSRTNANVFDEAVRVTEGEVPARIHLIGVRAHFCRLLPAQTQT